MDITFKATPVEKAALSFIDAHVSGNNPSGKSAFFMYAANAASANYIQWDRVSRIRYEDYVPKEEYESRQAEILHLSCDQDSFMNVMNSIKSFFSLQKIQKAYAIRMILRFALKEIEEQEKAKKVEEENMTTLLDLDDFRALSIDEKLVEIYRLLTAERS